MPHLCDSSPGKEVVEEYLANLFNDNNFDHDDMITYKQWGQTDRSILLSVTKTVQKFIETADEMFDSLREHHFTAKAQSDFLRNLKANLAQGEAIVLLDFAENYIVQDAVQGYHWNNCQATLHPFVVYYKSADRDLQNINFCVITDYQKHDTVTVHCFISALVTHLKNALPFVT